MSDLPHSSMSHLDSQRNNTIHPDTASMSWFKPSSCCPPRNDAALLSQQPADTLVLKHYHRPTVSHQNEPYHPPTEVRPAALQGKQAQPIVTKLSATALPTDVAGTSTLPRLATPPPALRCPSTGRCSTPSTSFQPPSTPAHLAPLTSREQCACAACPCPASAAAGFCPGLRLQRRPDCHWCRV